MALLSGAVSGAEPSAPLPRASGTAVAVLEFRAPHDGLSKDLPQRSFLADVVRSRVVDLFPQAQVMTRENMSELLKAFNRRVEDCEGECEVETARKLNADYVISGEIVPNAGESVLSLKLHETRTGRFLSGARASGKTLREVESALDAAVAKLLRAIAPPSAAPLVALEAVPLPPSLPTGDAPLDADPDALVLYDQAFRLESRPTVDPDEAARVWRRLAEIKVNNPHQSVAVARANQWAAYAQRKKEIAAQTRGDRDRLTKLLPLETISTEQKMKLLVAFATRYGATAPLTFIHGLLPPKEREAICPGLLAAKIGIPVSVRAVDEVGKDLVFEVAIDGVSVGKTPVTVAVPPCAHAVSMNGGKRNWRKGLHLDAFSPETTITAVVAEGFEETGATVQDSRNHLEWVNPRVSTARWVDADRTCYSQGKSGESEYRLPTRSDLASLPPAVARDYLGLTPGTAWTGDSAGLTSKYTAAPGDADAKAESREAGSAHRVICVRALSR